MAFSRGAFFVIMGTMALSGCNESAPEPKTVAEVTQALTSEATFRGNVVGQELTDSRRFRMIYAEDGSISGDHHGAEVVGSWDWQGETLCREMAVGLSKYGRKCISVAMRGDAVTFDGPGADPSVRWARK